MKAFTVLVSESVRSKLDNLSAQDKEDFENLLIMIERNGEGKKRAIGLVEEACLLRWKVRLREDGMAVCESKKERVSPGIHNKKTARMLLYATDDPCILQLVGFWPKSQYSAYRDELERLRLQYEQWRKENPDYPMKIVPLNNLMACQQGRDWIQQRCPQWDGQSFRTTQIPDGRPEIHK